MKKKKNVVDEIKFVEKKEKLKDDLQKVHENFDLIKTDKDSKFKSEEKFKYDYVFEKKELKENNNLSFINNYNNNTSKNNEIIIHKKKGREINSKSKIEIKIKNSKTTLYETLKNYKNKKEETCKFLIKIIILCDLHLF